MVTQIGILLLAHGPMHNVGSYLPEYNYHIIEKKDKDVVTYQVSSPHVAIIK